jgi:hypothetical protein
MSRSSFQGCQTTVVETCTTQCQDEGGAIFCDGQFVNASNLRDCAAELAAEISIDVDIDLDVDVDADLDVDADVDSDGDDDVKCSLAGPSGNATGNVLFGLTLAAGTAALIRRRRR